MSIQGDSGIAIKTALLSGLRIDELQYVYNQQVCAQDSCECEKLHVICKSNGLAIIAINWTRKYKKCYFTILPTRLWDNFRSMVSFSESDIKNANTISKQEAGIDFAEIRKIYYSVMFGTMDANEIQVLTGKAKKEVAIDCMTQKLDLLTYKYCKAWEKFGVILPVV
jgi:intergrase/recombinase